MDGVSPEVFANIPSAEVSEKDKHDFARGLSVRSRIWAIVNDPECRQVVGAGFRTIANTGVTAADFVPVVGDVVSWGADGLKTLRRIFKATRIMDPKILDLTPDVSLAVAIGSEATELMTGGIAPSHAVEGLLQLKHDWPRMKEGTKKALDIWLQQQVDEVKDYEGHKEEIDKAIAVFEKKKPTTPEASLASKVRKWIRLKR